MAKITHPDMRRGQETPIRPSPPRENYVVENAAEPQEPLDQRLAAFEERPAAVEVPTAAQAETNKKLEHIIFMGRHVKTIDLAEHKFELGTLTHKENNEIMSKLMKIGEAVDLFTIRTLTLAHALKSIDGVKLVDMDIDGEYPDLLTMRSAIVDNMQLALVEKLYTAYEALVKEADSVVYGEAIKN